MLGSKPDDGRALSDLGIIAGLEFGIKVLGTGYWHDRN